MASNGAQSDLQTSWQERRMPDDYPKLVLANVPQIPAEIMTACRQGVETGTTGWLDLYPCDKDRIAHAAAEEPGEGIFPSGRSGHRRVFQLRRAWPRSRRSSSIVLAWSRDHDRPALPRCRDGLEPGDRPGGPGGGQPLFPGRAGPHESAIPLSRSLSRNSPDLSAARQSLVAARTELEAARAANLASRRAWRRDQEGTSHGRVCGPRARRRSARRCRRAWLAGGDRGGRSPRARASRSRAASGSSPSANHLQGPPRAAGRGPGDSRGRSGGRAHAGRPRPPRRGARCSIPASSA